MTKITGFTREELDAIVAAVEERIDVLEEDGDPSLEAERVALSSVEMKTLETIASMELAEGS